MMGGGTCTAVLNSILASFYSGKDAMLYPEPLEGSHCKRFRQDRISTAREKVLDILGQYITSYPDDKCFVVTSFPDNLGRLG